MRALLAAQYRAFASELAAVSSERFIERALELDDHGPPLVAHHAVDDLSELLALVT